MSPRDPPQCQLLGTAPKLPVSAPPVTCGDSSLAYPLFCRPPAACAKCVAFRVGDYGLHAGKLNLVQRPGPSQGGWENSLNSKSRNSCWLMHSVRILVQRFEILRIEMKNPCRAFSGRLTGRLVELISDVSAQNQKSICCWSAALRRRVYSIGISPIPPSHRFFHGGRAASRPGKIGQCKSTIWINRP